MSQCRQSGVCNTPLRPSSAMNCLSLTEKSSKVLSQHLTAKVNRSADRFCTKTDSERQQQNNNKTAL